MPRAKLCRSLREPGQRVSVELRAAGADVRGRIVLSDVQKRGIDFRYSLNYLVRKSRGTKPPLEVAIKRFDWRDGWNDAWRSTAEGNAYLQTLHHFVVPLSRDGEFRVRGVSAGEYELALKVYERKQGSRPATAGVRTVRLHVTEDDVGKGVVDLDEIQIAAAASSDSEMASEFETALLGDTVLGD